MGTKIKPIKCPNCGSEKHTHKEDKCYLCQSCGTEYYIDDDDININVNHRFDYIPSSNDTIDIVRKLGMYALLAIAIGSFVILLPIFYHHRQILLQYYPKKILLMLPKIPIWLLQ